MSTKQKGAELLVCHETHATHEQVYVRGTRLRADHPAVKANPDYWVPDGTDDAELARIRSKLFAGEPPAPVEPMLRPLEPPIPAEKAMLAIRDFPREGVTAGDRLRKGHKLAKKHPDAFVAVVPSGLARADALVAKKTISHERDGDVRIVHGGQWVHRDDELVALHPFQFELPAP
jgi:hypothetical protein